MEKMRKWLFALLTMVIMGIVASAAYAVPVEVREVKLDGDVITDRSSQDPILLDVERGDELTVKVQIYAQDNDSNVLVRASIDGYEYHDKEATSDSTHLFDIEQGVTYVKTLSLRLPDRLDQDEYWLKIEVEGRNSAVVRMEYRLKVDTKRHHLVIKDVVFSPETEIMAGRTLLSTVRIKNMGEKDEEGLRIKVSLPELGVSGSDYIDELESEESTTSEEIRLKVPQCTEPGEYKAVVKVEYDEGYEATTKEFMLTVVGDESCGVAPVTPSQPQAEQTEKTIITVGPEVQDVQAGEGGAIYPLTLSNAGTTAKTYTVGVEAADWATLKVSPSNVVVVQPGESKAVYVYVSAKESAAPGLKMFAVAVKSGETTLKEVVLKANVQESKAEETSDWSKVKKGLEIGLVVLVILLVILGLIIGFNRLRAEDDAEEEQGQTYY